MIDDNNTIKFKILLLGDSSVGRRSLFKKLTSGVFMENAIATIGVDRRSFNVEIEVTENEKKVKKLVNISLVNTAGQDRFRTITKSYIKGSDGTILMYDLTNKESFAHVENWINIIYEAIGNMENSPYLIMLLGNKLDLIENKEKEREVKLEEGENKCKEHKIMWGGECSVKDFSLDKFKEIISNFVTDIYGKIGKKSNSQVTKVMGKAKKKRKKKCGFF